MKDLNLLYTFEALWRDHSASVAAANMGLTQAAVSSSLKRLRQEFGDKLFTLVDRRMEPTPFAVQIAPWLLESLEMARQAATYTSTFSPSTCRSTFTLRMRDVGEVVCLPYIRKALTNEAPNCRVHTTAGSIDDTLNGLATGRINMAIGYLPTLQTDIHSTTVFSQHYVCVMRKGHPLEHVKITQEKFVKQHHLLVESGGSGHYALERALVEAGARENIRLRIPQYLAAPHLILESDMIWVAPDALAKTLARFYPISLRPLPLELPSFEIAMYWHDRFHREPQNKWLREVIGAALRESVKSTIDPI